MPLGFPIVDFIIFTPQGLPFVSRIVTPNAKGNKAHSLFYSTNILICRVFTIISEHRMLS
jgi:hypothetical protein